MNDFSVSGSQSFWESPGLGTGGAFNVFFVSRCLCGYISGVCNLQDRSLGRCGVGWANTRKH